MEKLKDSTDLVEKMSIFSEKVEFMRLLQRKKSGIGLSESELNDLNTLENTVDRFFMLPIIPHAKAQ
jgi:hypothetical protein